MLRKHKCKRCGKCCQEEVCLIGAAIYKNKKTPCEGLKRRGKKFVCELIEVVSYEQKWFLFLLMGVGLGCTYDS